LDAEAKIEAGRLFLPPFLTPYFFLSRDWRGDDRSGTVSSALKPNSDSPFSSFSLFRRPPECVRARRETTAVWRRLPRRASPTCLLFFSFPSTVQTCLPRSTRSAVSHRVKGDNRALLSPPCTLVGQGRLTNEPGQ